VDEMKIAEDGHFVEVRTRSLLALLERLRDIFRPWRERRMAEGRKARRQKGREGARATRTTMDFRPRPVTADA
jgi:hypothetical protein